MCICMVSRLFNDRIFFVKFSVFKNFTNAILFSIKSPNFQSTNLDRLFPFLVLTEYQHQVFKKRDKVYLLNFLYILRYS